MLKRLICAIVMLVYIEFTRPRCARIYMIFADPHSNPTFMYWHSRDR